MNIHPNLPADPQYHLIGSISAILPRRATQARTPRPADQAERTEPLAIILMAEGPPYPPAFAPNFVPESPEQTKPPVSTNDPMPPYTETETPPRQRPPYRAPSQFVSLPDYKTLKHKSETPPRQPARPPETPCRKLPCLARRNFARWPPLSLRAAKPNRVVQHHRGGSSNAGNWSPRLPPLNTTYGGHPYC